MAIPRSVRLLVAFFAATIPERAIHDFGFDLFKTLLISLCMYNEALMLR